jgi:hypothetical protein
MKTPGCTGRQLMLHSFLLAAALQMEWCEVQLCISSIYPQLQMPWCLQCFDTGSAWLDRMYTASQSC